MIPDVNQIHCEGLFLYGHALSFHQIFRNGEIPSLEIPALIGIMNSKNLRMHDIYGFGDGIYPIERVIVTHEQLFNDRAHILYVNGAYRGNDSLGDLMHDFSCNDPDDMKNTMLAEASRYYKENPKGVEIMCKAMEEMREESYQRGVEAGGEQKVRESIKNIMKNLKLTVHQAMDALGIPADDQPKYLAKL